MKTVNAMTMYFGRTQKEVDKFKPVIDGKLHHLGGQLNCEDYMIKNTPNEWAQILRSGFYVHGGNCKGVFKVKGKKYEVSCWIQDMSKFQENDNFLYKIERVKK